MSLLLMVLRSFAQRRVGTALTALGVALGVMLVAAILALQTQLDTTYRNQGSGFPIVVGAKGSSLQLTLNVVYQMDVSPGNMPFKAFPELEQATWVKLAVPYAVGDAFRGFRVVATTDAIFSPDFHPLPGKTLTFASGKAFHFDRADLDEAIKDVEAGVARPSDVAAPTRPESHGAGHAAHEHDHEHEEPRESVIGSDVAAALGITVGAKIEPTHGIEGGKQHEHEHFWTVSGVLEHTGTALDRVVLIGLDSFYGIEEHREGARLPATGEAGLSAVVVFPKGPLAKAMQLPRLNKRLDIQAVDPSREIRKLLDMVGDVRDVFFLVALLVVVVGVLSIAVALYNTMNERRREIAILRAIGARRSTVVGQLVCEATLIAVMGALAGLGMSRILLVATSARIASASGGLVPDPWQWTMVSIPGLGAQQMPAELVIVLAVAVVGALAGLLPATKAYRTPVAENLVPLS